jgi:hypothetical protein
MTVILQMKFFRNFTMFKISVLAVKYLSLNHFLLQLHREQYTLSDESQPGRNTCHRVLMVSLPLHHVMYFKLYCAFIQSILDIS